MDLSNLEQELPMGNQTFAELRQQGKIYVDKTYFIYQLAGTHKPRILTRPRRFGKSTLLSTIEELFRHGVKPYDGHDSYFKGLAIESLWHDDGSYLVLHLNFDELNAGCATVAEFEQKLMGTVTTFCDEHQIDISDDLAPVPYLSAPLDFSDVFHALIENVPNRSLVLLIDEFDAPLIAHANDQEELLDGKLLLRSLFAPLKRYLYKFRCVFFTGTTSFQGLDLGPSANNFTDVSYYGRFATCCGYTRAELKQYFMQHLRSAAAIRNDCTPEAVSAAHIEALLDELSDWYGGYSFDGAPQNQVFAPWSVLKFLGDTKARLQPYQSTEQELPQLLKNALERLDGSEVLQDISCGKLVVDYYSFMESSPINPEAHPYALLFQNGYLTFSRTFLNGDPFHFKCPNQEINIALSKLLGQQAS